MRIPLPGSMKSLVILIVLFALLPPLGLIIYSGADKINEAKDAADQQALSRLNNVVLQNRLRLEGARVFLSTLSQVHEVVTGNADECSVLFYNIEKRAPFYENIRLVAPSGSIVAASYTESLQPDAHLLKTFQQMKNITDFSVIGHEEVTNTRSPHLDCWMPVVYDGKTVFYLVVSVNLWLSEKAHYRKFSNSVTRLTLQDKSGVIIYSSPPAKQEHAVEDAAVFEKIKMSRNSLGVLKHGAQKIVYERLMSPERGLYFTVRADLSPDYNPMENRNVSKSIVLLSLAACLAILIAVVVTHLVLVSPIKRLLSFANNIKGGDLSSKLPSYNMAKEFSLLAESLNTMAESLKKRGDDLIEAREKTEHANKTKGEFLANVSHEIRTPMNAILGMCYLALRGDLTPQQKKYLENIHSEATILLQTINDILDISKIEAGKSNIERVPFDLGVLLSDLCTKLSARFSGKKLSIALSKFIKGPRYSIGDPTRIEQILTILITGMARHTAGTQITLGYEVLSQNESSMLIRFILRDTVTELSNVQLSSFVNLDGEFLSHENSESYSFLNKAVLQRLMDIMGGEINASSPAGQGTWLTVDIPLGISESPEWLENLHDLGRNAAESYYTIILSKDDGLRKFLAGILNENNKDSFDTGDISEAVRHLAYKENGDKKLLLMEASLCEKMADALSQAQAQDSSIPLPVTILLNTEGHAFEQTVTLPFSGEINPPFVKTGILNTIESTIMDEENKKHIYEASEKALSKETDNNLRTELPNLDGVRVLLTEDNPTNQLVASGMLQEAGVEVTIANNGEEALEILRNQTFDLVFMDIEMPVMDGISAIKKIRSQEALKDLPVIAMTGHDKENEWERCAQMGMSDFIEKPFSMRRLVAVTHKWAKSDKSS